MNTESLTAKLLDLVEGRETPESWRNWWDEHEPELEALLNRGEFLKLKPCRHGFQWVPVFGSQKGAIAILEKSGTAFEASDLYQERYLAELDAFCKEQKRVQREKQKEFKAIKNSIIREADRLHLELEQEEMDSTNPNANEESGEIDSTETPPKTDSAQQPIKSPAVNNHNPAVITAVTRLLYHMGQIFRDNAMAPTSPLGLRIDSKRRKKLMAKRLALGHKADDHEEQGWQNGPSM